VMRIALIYGLLDQSPQVQATHLKAGLALWDCAEASTKWVFGDQLGDPTADRIVKALRQQGQLDETDIRDLFRRNTPGREIDRALNLIQRLGLAKPLPESTGGRPRIIWRLTT